MTWTTIPGCRAPGDHRRDRRRVDLDLGIEARRRRPSAACASAATAALEVLRRARAARRPTRRSSRRGRSCPARPPPSIVMLQIVIRFSIESPRIVVARVLDRVARPSRRRPAGRSSPGSGPSRSRPGPSSPAVVDPHRLRSLLDQALGRQHVLDLRGADPERERAERAVGRRCGCRRRRSSGRAGSAPAPGRSRARSPGGRSRASRSGSRTRRSCAPGSRPERATARRRSGRAVGVPSVGTLWSAVATVLSGRRTSRRSRRSPSNACGEVTSWTR